MSNSANQQGKLKSRWRNHPRADRWRIDVDECVFERINRKSKKRGPMNFKLCTAAAAICAASLVVSSAWAAGDGAAAKKKHHEATKATTPPPPSVEDQINALRRELQGEINGLKSDLANKDAELKAAQQQAADAQAAAAKAQQAADAEQSAVSDNAAAVTTLQSTVKDVTTNQTSLATTISDTAASMKKAIDSPDTLHYKGITITPGGYAAGETVWRAHATGGDIPTAFSSLPYEGADAYALSEFYGSARQSRVTMMAEGKTGWGKMRAYYEADWLGTGVTSNNNQSNSYVMRERVLWGQAALNSGWAFTGGQMWSLATEDKVGISNLSSDIMTPQTIDPNYVAGFVWTRQYGFRMTYTGKHAAIGVAAENPQLLYSAALAGSTPYAILGSPGQNGGNYNAAVSSVSGTSYIQSYGNQTQIDSAGNTIDVAVPVYNTLTANTNITNISFNSAPDVIVKAALDPGWGHYEVIGLVGFAHELVFPGVTTNSVKFGGVVDNLGFNGGTPETAAVAKSSTTGSFNDSIVLGGLAASARFPIGKAVSFGVKGLYGPGMGRYGDSTLSDVTNDANGQLAPIHNLSGLITLEANPTSRLSLYANYGGDYAGRADFATKAFTLGSPSAEFCESAVTSSTPAAVAATECSKTPTQAMIAAGGTWGSHFSYSPAITPIGYGSRYASVSATCATQAVPGYQSGSVSYLPAGSGCGNNTRDVQEITGGYWYDLYKGEHGRLRQSIQYGYAVREGWSGTSTSGAQSTPLVGIKGIDNMFWTSFRYYLP
jgi:hypothetical protein